MLDDDEIEIQERKSFDLPFKWQRALCYAREENILPSLKHSLRASIKIPNIDPVVLKRVPMQLRATEHYLEQLKDCREEFFRRTVLDTQEKVVDLFEEFQKRLSEVRIKLNAILESSS